MTRERDVRQILDDLGVQADERGLESLSREERKILLPWVARGEIGNGGFRYFFEGSHDLAEVVRGFHDLGCHDVARACERVLTAFPTGRPDDLSLVDWERFSAEEDVVYALTWEQMLTAIVVFVTEHQAAFNEHQRALKRN